MTSAKQFRANRENAKRSTGPRTRAGKVRSKLNSLRHGLAAAFSEDPTFTQEVAALASAIAGGAADDPIVLARAASVAEAELALLRVRLIRRQFADYSTVQDAAVVKRSSKTSRRKIIWDRLRRIDETGEDIDEIIDETFTPAGQQADTLRLTASELARFDRYERRALSRRRKAIRAFDQALAEHARQMSVALGS